MGPLLRLGLASLLAVGPTACGSGDGGGSDTDGSSICGPAVRERLDASSALHLLPNAPEPTYLSDPPTSGPHLSGLPPTGAVDAALDRPTQVLILETGGVLIQHRELSEDQVSQIQSLASDQVVVAPNPTLPASVVATAWVTKMTCTGVDVEALARFVEDNAGRGPEDS